MELKSSDMKDRDTSVILKNVKIEDNGKYECHVIQDEHTRRKRASFDTTPVKVVNLIVEEPGLFVFVDVRSGGGVS